MTDNEESSSDEEASPALKGSSGRRLAPGQKAGLRPALAVGAALVIGFVLYLFMRSGGGPELQKAANLEELPPGLKQCLVYGDPHIYTWDSTAPEPTLHATGEYWLVRTAEARNLKIQGQFEPKQVGNPRSSLVAIMVGGLFMGNHTVYVGTLDSNQLTVDGIPVMGKFPSAFFLENGLGTMTYNDAGVYVDTDTYGLEKHVVTLRFTRSVSLSIFRWHNYLDVRIRVPGNLGIDGACGNNNGFGDDDTVREIYTRGELRVAEQDSMFKFHPNLALTPEASAMLQTCTPTNRLAAKDACSTLAGDGALQCNIDVCFGTAQHNHSHVDT